MAADTTSARVTTKIAGPWRRLHGHVHHRFGEGTVVRGPRKGPWMHG